MFNKSQYIIPSLLVFLYFFSFQQISAQTFKLVITKFEDRTGYLAHSENEIKASATGGVLVGNNAGAVTVSGQRSDTKTESGKGDLGSQAADIFTTELVKTGKFTVLDVKLFEKALEKSESGDMLEAAKSIGAHYLLTGTITEAGISETGGTVLGFGGKSVQGKASLNLTLTNTSTGEVTLAESSEGTQSEGGVTLFGGEVGGKKDLGLLISKALKNAVENCLQKINDIVGDLSNYPTECELVLSDGVIYLSKGQNDGVMHGDEFEVIGVGKTIKIGDKLIQEKIRKGIIRVAQSYKDYSTASPENILINDGDFAIKLVKKNKK